MSGLPDSGSDATPHRRRRSNWWKSTPPAVRITVGVCLLLVAVGGVAIRERWFKAPPPSSVPATLPGKIFDSITAQMTPIDLVVTKSAWNEATRCIEGVVSNTSARPYSDVQITFYLVDRSEDEITAVTIPSLAPHGSANFATRPLDRKFREWAVRYVKGTPGPAPRSR